MKKRITVQDIADELGLSRNTVSKAINGTGNVSAETRNLIFQKAAELGYKQFSLIQSSEPEPKPLANREIALFTRSVPGTQHLSSTLLDSFQKKISTLGYRLTIYMLRDEIVSSCSFPENFNTNSTDAILILELFDKPYTSFLCSQPIPTLFVDSFANLDKERINSDILYMENKISVYQLISNLFKSGCKNIGFVGDHLHCQSFYERWCGYKDAMESHSQTNYTQFCILADDRMPYIEPAWLAEQIKKLPSLPDAFFCANDFLAICTIKALRSLNYRLPDDVKVAGFDNSNEAQIVDPPLTTVSIYGHQMGYMATDILLDRIKYPDKPYSTTYVQTDIVFRSSTGNT